MLRSALDIVDYYHQLVDMYIARTIELGERKPSQSPLFRRLGELNEQRVCLRVASDAYESTGSDDAEAEAWWYPVLVLPDGAEIPLNLGKRFRTRDEMQSFFRTMHVTHPMLVGRRVDFIEIGRKGPTPPQGSN